MCRDFWALAASSLELYRTTALPWVRFKWNVMRGPCCKHSVRSVEPSICRDRAQGLLLLLPPLLLLLNLGLKGSRWSFVFRLRCVFLSVFIIIIVIIYPYLFIIIHSIISIRIIGCEFYSILLISLKNLTKKNN